MSGDGWRPFPSLDAAVVWFGRNCGHCRLRVIAGRCEYPAPPCFEQIEAVKALCHGQALPAAFFRRVFGREAIPAELQGDVMIGKCKSRDYAGGRGRKSEAVCCE